MQMPEQIEKLKIKINGGKEYLPVYARVLWFRLIFPGGGILTEMVEFNKEERYAIFRATITSPEGNILSTATKREDVRGFGDFLEKAETGSVGRALSLCGFGTADLGDDEIVEVPRGAKSTVPPVAARQVDSAVPAKEVTVEHLKGVVLAAYPGENPNDDDLRNFFWENVEGYHQRTIAAEVKAKWPSTAKGINDGIRIVTAQN